MIGRLHDMRRHEEGQALVLATISMLILTLCVLATINLTFAADQKIKLQNAADAAAYTTAAYEARTLNFLAYSNRAMIVQYVAEMNLMALTSYFSFNLGILEFAGALAQDAGVIGDIIAVIIDVVAIIYAIITWTTFFATFAGLPLLDYANFGLSFAQYAVTHSISDTSTGGTPIVKTGPLTEVQNADPLHPGLYTVTNLSQTLLGIDETQRWYSNNGTPATGSMVQTDPWDPENVAPIAGQAAYDRLAMVELVNAARTPWTAYGTGGFAAGMPRNWQPLNKFWGIGGFGFGVYIGKSARTEWGALTPTAHTTALGTICRAIGGAIGVNPCAATEEIYSLDRFQVVLTFEVFGITITGKLGLDSFAYADRATWADSAANGVLDILQLLGLNGTGLVEQDSSHSVGFTGGAYSNYTGGGGLLGYIIQAAVDAVVAVLNVPLHDAAVLANGVLASSALNGIIPPSLVPLVHFGMVPYARYRPAPQPGGVAMNVTPSAPQLFNQPPVLMMVTVPETSLQTLGQPFIGHQQGWGFKIGGISSGGSTTDPQYNLYRNRQASKEGYVNTLTFQPGATNDTGIPMPASMNSGGMAAISAAMAYYHRPGDWREPPNLFNPMWGAKLMPVSDYPTIAQVGGALLPLLNTANPSQAFLVH